MNDISPSKAWTVGRVERNSSRVKAISPYYDLYRLKAGAKRVIGHTVGTAVGRVYNRHAYVNEKRIALERLASIDRRDTFAGAG